MIESHPRTSPPEQTNSDVRKKKKKKLCGMAVQGGGVDAGINPDVSPVDKSKFRTPNTAAAVDASRKARDSALSTVTGDEAAVAASRERDVPDANDQEQSVRGQVLNSSSPPKMDAEVANVLTDLRGKHSDTRHDNGSDDSPSQKKGKLGVGKGFSGICSECKLPIANRISTGLRQFNSHHSDSEKICGACFKLRSLPKEKVAEMNGMLSSSGDSYFPWFIRSKPVDCLTQFSFDKDAIKENTIFSISYNYTPHLNDRIHFECKVTNVSFRDDYADLFTKASTSELGTLRMHSSGYPVGLDVRPHENTQLGAISHYSWTWPSIPLRTIMSCLHVSHIQMLTGSIVGSPVILSRPLHPVHKSVHLFITDQDKLVFYPYVYPMDVDVQFLGDPVNFGGVLAIDERYLSSENGIHRIHPYSSSFLSHIHIFAECPAMKTAYAFLEYTYFCERGTSSGVGIHQEISRTVFEIPLKTIDRFDLMQDKIGAFLRDAHLVEVFWPHLCASSLSVKPDQVVHLRSYLQSKKNASLSLAAPQVPTINLIS